MATKKEETALQVDLRTLNIQSFQLKIVGDSPLICHAWSEKAKKMMLNKQQKKAATAKEIRCPLIEFADSLYWLTPKPDLTGLTNEQAGEILAEFIPQSKFGFPAVAFKSAALDAGYQQGALVRNSGTGDLSKPTARGAIRVLGEAGEGEYAVIEGTPTPREDIGRIGNNSVDLRYRAEFKDWQTKLQIQYNASVISPEQVINLFVLGGFANGVGDWRPAKDGIFGTFHVE